MRAKANRRRSKRKALHGQETARLQLDEVGRRPHRPISMFGYLFMLASLGGFGLWASTAPLAGATIAAGYVAAAGQNVMIQHLEGGIIKTDRRPGR